MSKKYISRWGGVALALVSTFGFFVPQSADAAQITNRKLTLVASTDGGSKPGGIVRHKFDFSLPSANDVGSIKFEYCLTAADTGVLTCTMPTGLVTTGATLEDQQGATGFTLDTTTNGAPYLTRVAASITPGAVSYTFDNVTNPTTTNQTFFVRIYTYASADTSGTPIDNGTVAAATATQIVLTGIMPESLVFCTGEEIFTTGGVPDCLTATPGAVDFDRLFSPTDTSIATSQMAASTNAGSGYVISVFGNTLESGANQVVPMTASTAGIRGTSQFGLNLRLNTNATSTPVVGTDIAPVSNQVNYRGNPLTGYSTPDSFKFLSGDNIADSADATPGATDAQIYTASYIVNVPGSQPAGTYTTTLTYICTPTF